MDNVTRWLAVDVAQRRGAPGVRVNAIAPGFFIATQNRAVLVHADGSFTERAENILARRRWAGSASPKNSRAPVVWLCSDAASFVTGRRDPASTAGSARSADFDRTPSGSATECFCNDPTRR